MHDSSESQQLSSFNARLLCSIVLNHIRILNGPTPKKKIGKTSSTRIDFVFVLIYSLFFFLSLDAYMNILKFFLVPFLLINIDFHTLSPAWLFNYVQAYCKQYEPYLFPHGLFLILFHFLLKQRKFSLWIYIYKWFSPFLFSYIHIYFNRRSCVSQITSRLFQYILITMTARPYMTTKQIMNVFELDDRVNR